MLPGRAIPHSKAQRLGTRAHREVEHLDVTAQAGMRVPSEVGAQQLFELGLIEHAGRWKTMASQPGIAVELGQYRHVAIDEPQAVGRAGYLGELAGDPEPGQDPVDLVVEVNRARLRIHLRPAIQHEAVHTVLGQQRGGGHPGGPATDDRDRNMFGMRGIRRSHDW